MIIFTKGDFTLTREAEERGHVVALTNIVERIRSEQNEKLSRYFREKLPAYSGIVEEDDMDEVVDAINEHIEEQRLDKHPLEIPRNGSDIYLLPLTQNLQLKVLVADEYQGDGEYEKYLMANFFIMNHDTTIDDVDQLINFLSNSGIR